MVLPKTAASPSEPLLDVGLLQKYSLTGPRYTSYPPATKFTTDLEALDLEAAIAADNGPDAGALSLYFHLPFCETLCWYCGCNTVITRRRESATAYVDDLAREVDLYRGRIGRHRPVKQIHLGGGTPTFLPPEELARLGMLIHESFDVDPGCEFGVEIDPRRLTRDHVEALRVIGATRASLGVQDTNPEVQIAIHRWQPQQANIQAVEWLRSSGFTSINVDLIFGLPLQTRETFSRTVDDVLELGPDRLSIFGYAHVPWIKPAQRILESRAPLPAAAERLAMFAVAHEKLENAGYVDIGLDHFARPDDELAIAQRRGTLHRNFQGYSTEAGASLYGFGISSISSTTGSYRQNFKGLEEWRAALTAGRLPIERGLVLTEDDQRRRAVIMRVMCDRRLDYAALSEALGVDVRSAFRTELAGLADLEADGLVEMTESGMVVTRLGEPLLRVIAMRFDATLVPGAQRHSQTV